MAGNIAKDLNIVGMVGDMHPEQAVKAKKVVEKAITDEVARAEVLEALGLSEVTVKETS